MSSFKRGEPVVFWEHGDESILFGTDNAVVARGEAQLLERAAYFANLGALPSPDDEPEVYSILDSVMAPSPYAGPDESDPTVRTLNIGNTFHCNMGCSYCYNELPVKDRKGSESPGGMSAVVARQMVESLLREANGAPEVTLVFIGGEPLLKKPVLYETVEYARDLAGADTKVNVTVYTNGTLMDEAFLEWANATRSFIVLSLDGPPDLNDRHRVFLSGRPSSRVVLKNIRRYMDQFWSPIRRVTSVATERGHLRPLAQYLMDLGFNDLQVQTAYGDDGFGDRGKLLDTVEVMDWYRELLHAGTVISLSPFSLILKKLAYQRRATANWYPCTAGHSMLGVGPDGSLYPCHHYVEEGNYRIGNVFEGIPPLEVRRPYFKRVDQREPCRSCWARHACGGECYHRASTAGQRYDGVIEDVCRERKSLIGLVLELFAELGNSNRDALRRLVASDLTQLAPKDEAYAIQSIEEYKNESRSS